MSCTQGCVSGNLNVQEAAFCCLCILLVSYGILYWLYLVDGEFCVCDKRKIDMVWGTFALPVSIFLSKELMLSDNMGRVGYALFAVYLILCSVMDYFLKMVCDFFQYIGLLGGCILLLQKQPSKEILIGLLLFCVIQRVLFFGMYGVADVDAFVLCAMVLAAAGKDMESYLLHMAVTFLCLGVVQGVKRNISPKGNLKQSVALLPYITVGFLVII